MKKIYLDYAAATPMADEVIAAMKPYFKDKFYNPSAIYLDSRAVKNDLNQARGNIAHWLGANSDEIFFTAGATESDNLAISGIMNQFPDSSVAVSAIEHEAVLKSAERHDYKVIPVDKNGRVCSERLAETIDDSTVLVSIMQANNEIGTIQPLIDLATVIKKVRDERRANGNKLPLYFHSDSTQAAAFLDLHINKLGLDLMSLNAAKIYGPKQVGVLYVRGGIKLDPLIVGGGQENGLRSGTENVAGAVGMAKALELVQSTRRAETKRLKEIIGSAEKQLKATMNDITVHGGKRKLPNNLSFSIPGLDGERAVMELDEVGIICATGSACSAISDESSHVIKALGGSENDARSTLRLTAGRQTSKADIEQAIKSVIEITQNQLKK